MTGGAPFPVDPVLTGIIINFKNADYIADKVYPRLSPRMARRLFKYMKFDFSQFITQHDTKVGRKGTPNEVEIAGTEVEASVEDYGLKGSIPQDDIDQAPDGYDPAEFTAESLWNMVQLDREIRCAGMTFGAANYGANNKQVLAGASQWSHVDSDPIKAIGEARETMVMDVNKFVLGSGSWFALRTNPKILKAITSSGTDSGMATREAVAELLEFDEIIVGKGWLNTAKPGQAPTRVRVWGNHATMFRQEPIASSIGSVPTFGWTAEYGGPVASRTFDKDIGLRGGEEVRSGESVKELISAPDLGYFFQDVAA